MALCKGCNVEKLSNEFPPVTVSSECDHPPLTCLRVCKFDLKVAHSSIRLASLYHKTLLYPGIC